MRAHLLCLAAVAALLAGCGTSEIDDAEAERFIERTVSEQVGANVAAVECPSGIETEKGGTFECTVTGDDDTSGPATVTQKDDEGNVSVQAPFIHVRDLEEQIGGGIAEQVGTQVQLDCPEIIVGEKGDTFACDVTANGEKDTVDVTQTDDQGNVRYELNQ